MDIRDKVIAAHNALDDNDLNHAERLIVEIEAEIPSISDPDLIHHIKLNLGGVLIDLGAWKHNEQMVVRGTEYVTDVSAVLPEDQLTLVDLYNAANGYSALWSMRALRSWETGRLDESYLKAKNLYRQAVALMKLPPRPKDKRLYTQLLVNYANALDSAGRISEAVEYYDRALRLDPSMSEAQGNKGIALQRYAFLARGHTHQFLLEAYRLLGEALKGGLHLNAVSEFKKHYDEISVIIDAHNSFELEDNTSPNSVGPFHDFMIKFCVQHRLYLTPTTFIGKANAVVYGDPMFVSRMTAPLKNNSKFDRYITFLNQIKQDYVLARYFLVQSQYRSEIVDVVDRDVALYYPLDYSLHSAYVQLLKTSFRAAVDVLDKIAFFIRDYCAVLSVPETNVYFKNIWAKDDSTTTLRAELASRKNLILLAFLDLALDLKKDGYYGHIYELRNALTHRFVVVHDMLLSDQSNPDIPRVLIDDLIDRCIQVMQVAKDALTYLIAFVDLEESRAIGNERHWPIFGIPVDDVFRWIPPQNG
jgi:tetratricopeptide (TPR) repeat protein